MGQNIQKKKAGRWKEGKGRGLVKGKVAVKTSLRTLEQSYTNQEDTYGKSILLDNDSSLQTKMEIYGDIFEVQGITEEAMCWRGMGQGRYQDRRSTVGNLAMQSCSYSGKSEHGSAPRIKIL